jgi:hypothetical protein
MTFYDVFVLFVGGLSTVGAFLAARQMSPGKVRYVGFARREVGSPATNTRPTDVLVQLRRDYIWEQYRNPPMEPYLGAGDTREGAYTLLISAGAGTGKTHLFLAQRLCLEFMNETAREMWGMAVGSTRPRHQSGSTEIRLGYVARDKRHRIPRRKGFVKRDYPLREPLLSIERNQV